MEAVALLLSILTIVYFASTPGQSSDSKIVGGGLISIASAPYMVSVQNDINGHFCGGSLLTLSSVLTGCHCAGKLTLGTVNATLIPTRSPDSLEIQAGSDYIYDDEIRIQRSGVTKILLHPKCSFEKYIVYDFAILLLQKQFESNRFVSPLSFFTLDMGTYDTAIESSVENKESSCFVIGFGATSNELSSRSNYLKAVRMRIIRNEDCQQKMGRENKKFYKFDFWNNGQICTLPYIERSNTSDCSGDSGGPFVCDNRLFAVISYGFDCGFWDTPNVYSKVSYFLDWYKDLISRRIVAPQIAMNRATNVLTLATNYAVMVLPVFPLFASRKRRFSAK